MYGVLLVLVITVN